ncbi:MAG: DegV family protein [Candidatus Nanopelagicales bacterium]|nr:DegV family protein [Candidatus Nanopelagicales bacterium]MDZ4250479.1 DegV family protein [Candidatus Nanopelagicales bacterium]
MHRVAVVTDSTSTLPFEVVRELGIRVVPVHVVVGGHSFDEGVEITPDRVAEALRDRVAVSTSRPTPAHFLDVYQDAADAGAEQIVSAHMSAELSGTCEAAVLAAEKSPVPVSVVDSRSVVLGLGFAVAAGARLAALGEDAEVVADRISSVARRSHVLFYVDTLDYLRRGGRVGPAGRLIGHALAVKPILRLEDGRVQPMEKVRTTSKAIARLEELAVAAAASGPSLVGVQHLDAMDRASHLAERLRDRLPDADVKLGDVGAVVGSHVGPGTLAVVVSPAEPA